jgi:hypothetical protein
LVRVGQCACRIAQPPCAAEPVIQVVAPVAAPVLGDQVIAVQVVDLDGAVRDLGQDRHDLRSTLVTSQLPLDHWHAFIGDATLADAILDRLVHNAYKINLKGESMRKNQATLTSNTDSE